MVQGRGFVRLLGATLLLATSSVFAEQASCERTSIEEIQLLSPKKGYYQVEVDYCYRPDTSEPVFLLLGLDVPEGHEAYSHSFPHEATPGQHSVRLELNRPIKPEGSFSTYTLAVRMLEGSRELVSELRQQRIDWPSQATYQRQRMFARYSNDELLAFAEERIDEGSSQARQVAREYLEKIVLEEPERVETYRLFARIAMADQQNAQGLGEARSYLDTAMQIDPDYADGYILRGFVLAHLRDFELAEADFRKAESLGVKNLWLWNNWAVKQMLQGNKDQALALYRRTLEGEKPDGRNQRARLNAFENLLFFLNDGQHLDEMDGLHQQRLSEFDERACLYVEYASFLLIQRQDYQRAIDSGHKALDGGCRSNAARNTLGIAYHVGSLERPELSGRAKVFRPEGAGLYWGLAQVQQAEPLLQRYQPQIDSVDGQGYTALAYALENSDLKAAQRLVALGASLSREIGDNKYPLALIPVFLGSVEGVRFVIEQGVDYGRIEYRGVSALDYARQANNPAIIELLAAQRKI